jgi:hypothetical protein
MGLSQEFATDPLKLAQWRAVLQKAGHTGDFTLADAIQELRDRILPLLLEEN